MIRLQSNDNLAIIFLYAFQRVSTPNLNIYKPQKITPNLIQQNKQILKCGPVAIEQYNFNIFKTAFQINFLP